MAAFWHGPAKVTQETSHSPFGKLNYLFCLSPQIGQSLHFMLFYGEGVEMNSLEEVEECMDHFLVCCSLFFLSFPPTFREEVHKYF